MTKDLMQKAKEQASELLRLCQTARESGKDFPTIWEEIIKRHPVVVGIPVQVRTDQDPALEISLLSGRKLIFNRSGFSLG